MGSDAVCLNAVLLLRSQYRIPQGHDKIGSTSAPYFFSLRALLSRLHMTNKGESIYAK